MKKEIKIIAFLAILIALALVLSYVDSLIVVSFVVPIIRLPGIKLGLANIAIIYTLYKMGIKEAILVSLVRLVLSSILFGSITTFLYGLCGAILSLSVMIILKKLTSFSLVAISIFGSIMHNIGQIIVAIFIMSTKEIGLYLPVLVISGIICGIAVGILSYLTLKYTKNITLFN